MTSDSPAVTVLMSVLNGQDYLADAIESIRSQTFDDFELLLIDDASTDDSGKILDRFASGDDRVVVLTNDTNLGLTRSLNKGLQLARGEFIARLDADDLALPGRLESQVTYMRDHCDCAVLGTRAQLIDADGNQTGETEAFSAGALVAQLLFFNSITHSSVMFRRQIIHRVGAYDEQFVRAQDYKLWLRCLAKGHRIELLDEILVAHRVHENRVTSNQSETMEHFRRRAVQQGWRDIVGVEVSEESIQLQHQLLTGQSVVNAPAPTVACHEYRRLREHFARKFKDDPEAIRHFDKLIKRLVRGVCKLAGKNAELYQRYALGMSAGSFRYQLLVRNFKQRLLRARFRIGQWRRNILGAK